MTMKNPVLIIVSFLLAGLLSCESEPKTECKHELYGVYKGFSPNNPIYFKNGSYWIYEDSLSNKKDIVTVTNSVQKSRIIDNCSYNFEVTDADIQYFSTARKKSFFNRLVFHGLDFVQVGGMQDVYYEDDSLIYWYFMDTRDPYFYKPSQIIRDSIQLFNSNGKKVDCLVSNVRTGSDSVSLTLVKNIGIVNRKVFNTKTKQLVQNWKLTEYVVEQ